MRLKGLNNHIKYNATTQTIYCLGDKLSQTHTRLSIEMISKSQAHTGLWSWVKNAYQGAYQGNGVLK